MNIKISDGNSKLGRIPSVSLPTGISCRQDCTCGHACYARRLERLRPSVRRAYETNWRVLNEEPDTYWREVEAAVMMSRFFRFHVSGDIPDASYFSHMVDVARRRAHCEILCFTKKFEIVNDYLSHDSLPANLHVIFSGWRGMEMDNPYRLPEAHVKYRDGMTTARPNAKMCGGNCTGCAVTDGGCWTLKNGEQVVFDEH